MSEKWQEAIKSYAKVFVAVILGLFLAEGADVFAVDMQDLRTWLAAGLSAVVPLVITAIDPRDHRFGKNSNV